MFKEYFGLRWEFDHDEVDKIIETHIAEHKAGYVVSVDGNNLTNAYNNAAHKDILNNAIVNNCDSKWVPRMVNRIYKTDYKNYCGADLFIDYIKKARFNQFFLGSNKKVLDGLKQNLVQYDPKIAEMRFEELPFRTVEEFDYAGIAKMVNEYKPDIIWVSLGCPKQEQFMSRLLPYLDQGVMFGYGAIFNFYSGLDDAPKRAPQWMIKLGFEWLYRVCSEPKKQTARAKEFIKIIPSLYREELKKSKKK
jgi:N-acetylglucosaminyldiphosphoundecaprenol N-acetyl-beta-D-mannosaminyltransferase